MRVLRGALLNCIKETTLADVTVDQVFKSFGAVHAVNGVSF